MSSRPLTQELYLNDTQILSNDYLPSLIEYDTLYYYSFDNEDDDTLCLGQVSTVEISKDKL